MEGSALGEDVWRMILARLQVSELSRAACVCRSWRQFAGDSAVLAAAFKSAWKLREVNGTPCFHSFWKNSGLGCFAISHTVGRSDTVAALAIKYKVQVSEIRRLNNMLSDHGIRARDRLLIPVTSREQVQDQSCYIELDFHSRREVAVIYPDGSRPPVVSQQSTHRAVWSLKKTVFDSMRRSLRLDNETAQYYLSLTGGDFRQAARELKQDLSWEENNLSG